MAQWLRRWSFTQYYCHPYESLVASGGHLAKIVSLHQKTPTFTRGHVDAFIMRNAGSEMRRQLASSPLGYFNPHPTPGVSHPSLFGPPRFHRALTVTYAYSTCWRWSDRCLAAAVVSNRDHWYMLN